MSRLPAVAAFLAALLIVGAACVPDTSPDREACLRPTIELQLELGDDGLEPGSPSVCRDQEVNLLVASERDGVLHIHGYDSEVPAFEIRDGETREITFNAGRSGQFPIEFHALDDPVGVSVGVFTVHEP